MFLTTQKTFCSCFSCQILVVGRWKYWQIFLVPNLVTLFQNFPAVNLPFVGDINNALAILLMRSNPEEEQQSKQMLQTEISSQYLHQYEDTVCIEWRSPTFADTEVWRHVALPGVFQWVQLCSQVYYKSAFKCVHELDGELGIDSFPRYNATLVWIHNNYNEFLHFPKISQADLDVCTKDIRHLFSSRKCFNVSIFFPSSTGNSHYLVNLMPKRFVQLLKDLSSMEYTSAIDFELSPEDLISWRDASDRCRQFNGTLPLLCGRKEVDELTAIFKLSVQFPPIEALYIGLKRNIQVKPANVIQAAKPLTKEEMSPFPFTHVAGRRRSGATSPLGWSWGEVTVRATCVRGCILPY